MARCNEWDAGRENITSAVKTRKGWRGKNETGKEIQRREEYERKMREGMIKSGREKHNGQKGVRRRMRRGRKSWGGAVTSTEQLIVCRGNRKKMKEGKPFMIRVSTTRHHEWRRNSRTQMDLSQQHLYLISHSISSVHCSFFTHFSFSCLSFSCRLLCLFSSASFGLPVLSKEYCYGVAKRLSGDKRKKSRQGCPAA